MIILTAVYIYIYTHIHTHTHTHTYIYKDCSGVLHKSCQQG